MTVCQWLIVFGLPRTICSDRGAQFIGGWFKAMCFLKTIRTRELPISAGSMAGVKCVEDSYLSSCARFESLTSAIIGLSRCGQLLRPLTTILQWVGFLRTTFSSAGPPWDADFPCQVMAWLWTPRSFFAR